MDDMEQLGEIAGKRLNEVNFEETLNAILRSKISISGLRKYAEKGETQHTFNYSDLFCQTVQAVNRNTNNTLDIDYQNIQRAFHVLVDNWLYFNHMHYQREQTSDPLHDNFTVIWGAIGLSGGEYDNVDQ